MKHVRRKSTPRPVGARADSDNPGCEASELGAPRQIDIGAMSDGREMRLKGSLSPTQEARAKELLLLRASERQSLAHIARECGLSRAYFIRAFASTMGRTPHQWLLEQRIDQARWLIEHSGRSLVEIAAHCGFSDQSHLTRVFVKAYGVPPGAWRKAVLR